MSYRRKAVAIEYGLNETPMVTARGDAELAERIIAEARRRGIAIAEDPWLASMLAQLEIGEAIPPQLYAAVATILAWVYWMKGMAPGDEKRDAPPGD